MFICSHNQVWVFCSSALTCSSTPLPVHYNMDVLALIQCASQMTNTPFCFFLQPHKAVHRVLCSMHMNVFAVLPLLGDEYTKIRPEGTAAILLPNIRSLWWNRNSLEASEFELGWFITTAQHSIRLGGNWNILLDIYCVFHSANS